MKMRYDQQGEEHDFQQPDWFQYIDIGFCLFWFVELTMRAVVEEWLFFFGDLWRWNFLDSVLLFEYIVEISLVYNSSSIKDYRTFKFFRSARIIRVLRSFQELRFMFLSILHSIKPFL